MYIPRCFSTDCVHFHQYANDLQLYTAIQPSANATFKSVLMSVEDVARWFLGSDLFLNPARTEVVVFIIVVQHHKIKQHVVLLLLYRPIDALQLPTCPLYRFLSNISVNS